MNNNNNNNNNNIPDEKVRDYIDVLYDAVKQRSTPQQIERYKKISTCIVEIYKILSKNNIKDFDDVIHILVSVVAVPTIMMQQDKQIKKDSLKHIAVSVIEEIETIQEREDRINESESGRELERLRQMLHKSDLFNLRDIE